MARKKVDAGATEADMEAELIAVNAKIAELRELARSIARELDERRLRRTVMDRLTPRERVVADVATMDVGGRG